MIPAMVLAANFPPASRFSPAKEQAAIRTLRQAHNRALAAYDVDGVIDLAAGDFMMILGGGQLIQGKPAYREFVATAFADPHPMLFVRTPDRIDVGMPESYPVAAETGRWVGTASDGGTRHIAGRYLVHWTKAGGEWRIASETYVTTG
jgi:ketosteroid isomerase-like protein